MRCFVQVDEQGRIESTTEEAEYASEGMFEFDFPDGFDFGLQDDYRIVEGELIADTKPASVKQQIEELRIKLQSTDYIPTKLMDYQIMGLGLSDEDAEKYSDTMAKRQEWRSKIEELQTQIEQEETE